MDTRLMIDLKQDSVLDMALSGGETMTLQTVTPVAQAGTTNYDKLANRPTINGYTLTGNMTSADLQIVSEDTTAGWATKPLYVPRKGEICIYTDHNTYTDEQGHTVTAPDMKVGDGAVPIVDLPFVGDGFRGDIARALDSHVSDSTLHVSAQDRLRWDAKLNYTAVGETLTFNRD